MPYLKVPCDKTISKLTQPKFQMVTVAPQRPKPAGLSATDWKNLIKTLIVQ